MNSKLFYQTSYSYILKQSNFKSIESLYHLNLTINRNKPYLNNIYYSNNRIMSRNLCLSCFPCIKIQKQNYSNSNENLVSPENQNQVAQTENTHKKCIFCHLDKNRIIYEDDKIIAFHDIKPAAKIHILIIPRAHIVSVKDLNYKDHKEILENMKVAGVKILKDLGYTKPCLKNENHKIYNYDSVNEESDGDKGIPILNTLLISNKEYDSILGFHIPPFTSVGHLHLHLLGLPFKNWVKSCKYKSIRFPHYFESIDNIIEELKKKEEKKKEKAASNAEASSSKQPQNDINNEHVINIDDSKPSNSTNSSSNANTSSSSSSVITETTPIYPKQPEMKV